MIILSLLCLVTAIVLWVIGAFGGSVMTLAFALGFSVAGGLFLAIGYAAAKRSVRSDGAEVVAGPAVGSAVGAAAPTGVHTNGSRPAPVVDAPPVNGYDDMTATQVVALVGSGALNRQQLARILGYEASHQARKTILAKVEAAVLSLAKQESSA